jgi:hypothetical protein
VARALLIAWLLGGAAVGAQPTASNEYDVKAAFLYNFLKYVEWPGSPTGPIIVCVAGQNPFGQVFFDTMRDQIAGREVSGRQITEPSDECNVIFVPSTASGAYVRHARGKPVLLVGESADFLSQGGIIRFVREGTKLQFEIDAEAARQAGLTISPGLLRLRRVPGARG